CTAIKQINRLAMNGTIVVSLYKNYKPEVGDSIVLWEATTFVGSPKFELPESYEVTDSETGMTTTYALEWDTSDISKGILRVAGVTNAIGKLEMDASSDDVYNLQGQLVRKAATTLKGLPQGVYLWHGRKIIMK
ncbi:MAG: hypothetical protein J5867_07840, partial [Prevotella sp.]|nr:hypothetical protein [Prevotella sp.]